MFMKSLDEYNEQVFNSLYHRYPHFQVGFFNSNLVLFIGQNPGKPYTEKDKREIEDMQHGYDYANYERRYTEGWKKTLFGNFIGQIINNHWELVSFTNYVKIPTENNEEPNEELIKQFTPILHKQIELLSPKLIVCLGKLVGRQFSLVSFYDKTEYNKSIVTMFPHPAYILRQDQKTIDKEIYKMHSYLNICT